MIFASKITSKGQTTIPAALRERLGVKEGDRLRFVEQPDGTVTVERDESGFESLKGLIKLDEPADLAQINAWIEDARLALGTDR